MIWLLKSGSGRLDVLFKVGVQQFLYLGVVEVFRPTSLPSSVIPLTLILLPERLQARAPAMKGSVPRKWRRFRPRFMDGFSSPAELQSGGDFQRKAWFHIPSLDNCFSRHLAGRVIRSATGDRVGYRDCAWRPPAPPDVRFSVSGGWVRRVPFDSQESAMLGTPAHGAARQPRSQDLNQAAWEPRPCASASRPFHPAD